jgi:hypothetical protein
MRKSALKFLVGDSELRSGLESTEVYCRMTRAESCRDAARANSPGRCGSLEASGHTRWFERLLAELQVELWIGDAAEIRTRRVHRAYIKMGKSTSPRIYWAAAALRVAKVVITDNDKREMDRLTMRESGECYVFDDDCIWHMLTPVAVLEGNQYAYRDTLVFDMLPEGWEPVK